MIGKTNKRWIHIVYNVIVAYMEKQGKIYAALLVRLCDLVASLDFTHKYEKRQIIWLHIRNLKHI